MALPLRIGRATWTERVKPCATRATWLMASRAMVGQFFLCFVANMFTKMNHDNKLFKNHLIMVLSALVLYLWKFSRSGS